MIHDCCFVDGIKINHTDGEVDALLKFIYEKEICGFIEMDMHEGGLALCLMNEMPRLHYFGITLAQEAICIATKLKIQKHKYTTMEEGDSKSADVVTKISGWVTDRWPIMFYFNCSSKQSQVNLYKNMVRYGDFIGIHGYWNKSRIIPEMPEFPYGELKPEVLDTDLKHLKHEFRSIQFEPLINTRIAILQRRTK